jgi:putative nucleotidyltransferase with HDIG domain
MQDIIARPIKGKLIALIFLSGTITLLHFLIPTDQHAFHILHIILRKLYFLPPVIAAAWYGFRGAAYVTFGITIFFSFHAILDWPGNYMEQANQGGELISFWVVGLVAGLLFERERALLKDLVLANEETLLALVSALDMKEHYTHLHSKRVRHNTLLLADKFGLDQTRKRAIGFGALLHDIGKIAVPDSILLKPEQLTIAEKKIMRNHPSVGYDILKKIGFLSEAAEIVYAHHEHYDGSGYPRGLKGEDIPLGARLFAVVDVYDALTSARPYHTPLSHEEALTLIKQGSNRHFDPEAVKAFLAISHNELNKF